MATQRLEAALQILARARLDALFVSHLPHVQYLTGFTGSNGCCIVTRDAQVFCSDGRYLAQAAEEVKGFDVVIARSQVLDALARRVRIGRGAKIAFEQDACSVTDWQALRKAFSRAKLVGTSKLLSPLISRKDEGEISRIAESVRISEKVYEKVIPMVKDGVRELDVAAEISYWHRKFGADADAFEPIVASGTRGALPHARASAREIRPGEFITVDFGCRKNGYHSDITRTVSLGKPSAELLRMYECVRQAQQKALDAIRPGMRARALDAVARKSIRKDGYGKFFNHSLGHGLGLEVHEEPRISLRSDEVLQPGNVVTIEPGIYVQGIGGVRIEDDVVVREHRCEILTSLPRSLTVL
ncbi:MAG TPA: Xaa-Pro peptidase family protein [Bacteroidota bacterium]|nr:Xaa-Pro peptidase family protein [Bacteroidota bacterium]